MKKEEEATIIASASSQKDFMSFFVKMAALHCVDFLIF